MRVSSAPLSLGGADDDDGSFKLKIIGKPSSQLTVLLNTHDDDDEQPREAAAPFGPARFGSVGSPAKKSRHKLLAGGAGQQLCGRPLPLANQLLLLLLLLQPLLLVSQLGCDSLVEAKMHHSKRQAPVTSFATPSTPGLATTGRENSNWWNVWWQRK